MDQCRVGIESDAISGLFNSETSVRLFQEGATTEPSVEAARNLKDLFTKGYITPLAMIDVNLDNGIEIVCLIACHATDTSHDRMLRWHVFRARWQNTTGHTADSFVIVMATM